MTLKELFNRRIFIAQTRLHVVYTNFTLYRAFKPEIFNRAKLAAKVAVVSVILMFAGFGISSNFFVGKSSANIPAGPAVIEAPAVARLFTPTEPAIIPDEITPPPPPSIPQLPGIEPRYVIAVEKSTRSLFVLKENGSSYDVVKEFEVSLGSLIGAKEIQGDLRTPEGIYKIVEMKEDHDLPPIYGPRAFVTDYPNAYDIQAGRTGGGIWLHGTEEGSITPDTRGCVELNNENILALEDWVGIDTTIAIFSDDFILPIKDGKLEKRFLTREYFYGDFQFPKIGKSTEIQGKT